jgi:glutaminyl-tRNA synthetase
VQFERLGYFCKDAVEEGAVFNRVVTLRDSWAKLEKQALQQS